MGKIDEALRSFKLNENFSSDELKRVYALEKDKIEYNYQMLIIFKKIRKLVKQTNYLENESFDLPEFKIFLEVDEFYKQEKNSIYLSKFSDGLKKYFRSFAIEIEKTRTSSELIHTFDSFMNNVKKECHEFISNILKPELKTGNINFAEENIFKGGISIRDVIVRTYNFAIGEEKLVTTLFKEQVEKYPITSSEYRRGLIYYSKMITSRTYSEAVKIYNVAKQELFPEETKSNVRKW